VCQQWRQQQLASATQTTASPICLHEWLASLQNSASTKISKRVVQYSTTHTTTPFVDVFVASRAKLCVLCWRISECLWRNHLLIDEQKLYHLVNKKSPEQTNI